jgi:hypothetical protein
MAYLGTQLLGKVPDQTLLSPQAGIARTLREARIRIKGLTWMENGKYPPNHQD